METTQCPILFCSPGSHLVYSKITHGFSWICTPCPENHFKSDAGNHHCTPCKGQLSVDNGERTACVDPYTDLSVIYTSKEFYIITSISMSVLLVAIVTITTFIIYRKTPIVMVSDFKISLLHMVILALTLVVTPLVFFTDHFCITKSLTFSILYTFNIGIVFIKSQKLLRAFLSKVILTSGEANRTMIGQFFTVTILLFVVNGVLFVSYYQQPAKILQFENRMTMVREKVCNTYFHNTTVMITIAVIQLMCAVQAFRGRNLPSVLNDGIILTYATFILTASFVVSFTIVPFQKSIEKEISQCVTLLINTAVIIFLLYVQKAYRILFYPEQNTRVFFHSQRMTRVKQNVNERIEMKQMLK